MMNSTMNSTIVGNPVIDGVSSNIFKYLSSMPAYMAEGNTVAIIIGLIVFFIAIILVNAISRLLLSFLKRTILFMIVLLVLYDAAPRYVEIISLQGWSFSTILIGLFAAVAGIFALYIASRSLIKSARDHIILLRHKIAERRGRPDKELLRKQVEIEKRIAKDEAILQEEEQKLKVFSTESLKNEKSLLAVLIYLIVAEFGVFSSPTLSAPNVQVGVMFFAVFMIGIVIFAKTTYRSMKTAFTYVAVTFAVGVILSFVLGVLWGKSTFAELLSPYFFTSDSLVATITGMGVSLFAGSKG